MPALVAQHPVMTRFRQALEAAYGARLERVVLYGSRARGEARPDNALPFAAGAWQEHSAHMSELRRDGIDL